jgi:beta-galactosidase/beta-glucuronidase
MEEECAGRVFLHFGAVDYECDVYVNGSHAGYHKGGYVSFRLDVTSLVRPGENIITVNARDDERNPMIPGGKQSGSYRSHGAHYTRTTGIWQTVWLEFTPRNYIKDIKFDTNAETGTLVVTAHLEGRADLGIEAFYEGKPMGSASMNDAAGGAVLAINLAEIHLWEPGAGRLYDLALRFGDDTVRSYFGLRSVCFDGYRFLMNGKSIFQRLILDQGFYPDGIYTAPSDEALCRDIDISMEMGFNGAQLHQKVFEERFLYHCDMKGYLVWGEYPSWGLDHTCSEAIYSILPEWLEVIR